MVIESRNMLRQLSIYSFYTMVQKAVGFLMLPFYTRYLDPAHYGTLELVEIIAAVFCMFAGAGMGYAVFKFYYQCDTKQEQDRLVSTALTSILLLHLLATVIGLLFSRPLSILVFGSPGYSSYLMLIFIRIITEGAISLGIDYLRIINRAALFGVLSLTRLVSTIGLNIWFLMRGMGVQGLLLSSITGAALIGIPLTIFLYSRLGFHFDKARVAPLFRYGTPFIAVSIGQFIINSADRFFLQRYTDLTQVGIYSLGYRLGFTVDRKSVV